MNPMSAAMKYGALLLLGGLISGCFGMAFVLSLAQNSLVISTLLVAPVVYSSFGSLRLCLQLGGDNDALKKEAMLLIGWAFAWAVGALISWVKI